MTDPNSPERDAFDLLTDDERNAFAQALGEGLTPVPMQPIERSLMRARLLARVRDAAPQRSAVTVAKDDGAWEPFSPRVQIKVLRHDPESTSYLLKLEAGAMIWPHRHAQDEECVVLEGRVQIGELDMGAGTFHLAPRGKNHEPIRTETGALLYLRGAMPRALDIAPIDALRAWWRG
jgi:mannose-6-phosphate isomerase-like protein (cupin superfamily)